MYNATQMRHLVQESVRGLARRKISGSVAVIIMGSALLTLALFSLVTINLDRLIQGVRGEIDMTVFLLPDPHPEDLQRLERDLLSTKGVRMVRFVSEDEALQRFRVELGEDARLLDAVGENPLPASFEIQLDPAENSAERVEDLARNLQQYPIAEDVLSELRADAIDVAHRDAQRLVVGDVDTCDTGHIRFLEVVRFHFPRLAGTWLRGWFTRSALAGLELGVALADHENLATTTHDFAVGVTHLGAAEGAEDLHGGCLSSVLKRLASVSV